MKIVLQRCLSASVEIDNQISAQIGRGLVVFLGIAHNDTAEMAAKLAAKIVALRIFDNRDGKFDRSVRDIGGEILLVSNFTVLATTHRGTRPSFSNAAAPGPAQALVDAFVTLLRAQNVKLQTGRFGADMKVAVFNDGPVTMVLEL